MIKWFFIVVCLLAISQLEHKTRKMENDMALYTLTMYKTMYDWRTTNASADIIRVLRDQVGDGNTEAERDSIARAIYCWSAYYGIPYFTVVKVIKHESGFNPKALGTKGDVGLMQIMPKTAKVIAKELDIDSYNLWNIDTNIRFGCHYLWSQHFAQWIKTLERYNGGKTYPHKVRKS